MADIFREVDEEVRQDRIQLALVRNWGWILLAALLVIAGVGGWRAYEYLQSQKAEQSNGRYVAALDLAKEGKPAEALVQWSDLAKSGTAGYALLSRFRSAAEIGTTNATDGAKAFDGLASDPTVAPEFQDVARIRAAILLSDSLDLDGLRHRLQPLADANHPMRNIARELLAMSALKANDGEAAGQWLDAIVADPTAQPSSRQRAEALLALVRAGRTAKP